MFSVAGDGCFVIQSLTVSKAAEQYAVDVNKLKETLSGTRRKHKQGIVEIQRSISQNHRSLSHKNAVLVRNLLDKFEDGDVSEKQVCSIFTHIEQLQKRSNRNVLDWKKRFESMNVKIAKSA